MGSLLTALRNHDIKTAHKVGYTEERIILFQKIYTAFTKGYSNDLLIFANLSFSYFFASVILPKNFENSKQHSIITSVSEKAIGFMKANIKTLITPNDTAAHCCLSVSFF